MIFHRDLKRNINTSKVNSFLGFTTTGLKHNPPRLLR